MHQDISRWLVPILCRGYNKTFADFPRDQVILKVIVIHCMIFIDSFLRKENEKYKIAFFCSEMAMTWANKIGNFHKEKG